MYNSCNFRFYWVLQVQKKKTKLQSYLAKILLDAILQDVATLDKQDTVHYKFMYKQHF